MTTEITYLEGWTNCCYGERLLLTVLSICPGARCTTGIPWTNGGALCTTDIVPGTSLRADSGGALGRGGCCRRRTRFSGLKSISRQRWHVSAKVFLHVAALRYDVCHGVRDTKTGPCSISRGVTAELDIVVTVQTCHKQFHGGTHIHACTHTYIHT